ncbi:hypothetical protein FB45DRAFT_364182 [Roridomyces roridus]|uniref:Uncharacterized protein n=1 Tax=Roridomyces roridus TaxID=1738132 RepID=A0AAD7FX56_9AGAR|nr:hypothetical protein FB45DRAFT_364182 [Roridomyces roridus]
MQTPESPLDSPSTPTWNDHRWSELVPPESGLTFAVIWDPDQDSILTFSAPALFSDSIYDMARSPDSPSDTDGRSQILTIGPGPSFLSPSEYACTTPQYLRENHDYLFPESSTPGRTRPQTRTSSTMDGLDVYLRGSMLGHAHKSERYRSCFRDLDGEFAFDPRTSFACAWQEYMENGIGGKADDMSSDEGFYSLDHDANNMSSAFSVTTTSTSNYVEVENEMYDDDDGGTTAWTALEPPNTPGFSHGLMFPPIHAPVPRQPHRLHKPRPPASPALVLHRPEYNHISSPRPLSSFPPPTQSPPTRPRTPTARLVRSLSLPKLARSFSFTRSIIAGVGGADKGGWVWISVKDKDDGDEPPPLPPPPMPIMRRASE